MYLKFYKLREYPFSITCDERYFYESPIHAEALANMMYTIQQRKGMVLITGEVGAGKTFLGNVLCSRLGLGCTALVMSNPPSSGKQLVRSLALRIGMSVRNSADKLDLTEELSEHLIHMHNRGRLVALILDEAQDLTNASLEEQARFFVLILEGRRDAMSEMPHEVCVSVHSVFDTQWKTGWPFYAWDSCTGLLDEQGRPRPAVAEIVKRLP